MAWKEMKKNKAKFLIIGAIVFLISLLTFIISGLANGLSQDNVSLIKNMPEGTFYMSEDSDDSHTQSHIDPQKLNETMKEDENAFAFSLQMGALKTESDNQQSVAFLTSTETSLFTRVDSGEVILDSSLKDQGIKVGDQLSSPQFQGTFEVVDFIHNQRFNHSSVAFINQKDFNHMFRTEEFQIIYSPQINEEISGLKAFTKNEFLSTIPSYQAEQMTLNMIVWFLIVISGMLFSIFFYMMNVQKIGMYGILKALGMRTGDLFKMIWSQMGLLTCTSLIASALISQTFQVFAPDTMPYHLPIATTVQLSVVFFVVGFLGSTISGFQIKKIEPLKAIQQGEA
ncbi:putative ABC transport system permease protein [Halobacillus karajensis]|uniref:Putative hemin transport system permease protein HrtB n=2 Tax=Halobacillus karajensis TaxID=195088 RepID=A0A024P4H0_9BACI|nr:FtsX-like permease family protein [Halobacillus karajensis]CDQ23658.1 FtsX-like permease family protein [Halobacillus karajensis]CDQ27136.1 FtsX-like permease family protein [Halobacillus karajensis]SEI13287.1 putative ABC transport system permease protein [Halobacillus karajensis]